MTLRERFAFKPVDAWWVVLVVDPITIPILMLLQRVPSITANHVSVGALLVGVWSAVEFWRGQFILGAVLFQSRFLLDCIDGKLARMRGGGTRLGWYLDHGLTFPSMMLIAVALAAGMREAAVVPAWMLWAMVYIAAMMNYGLFAGESSRKAVAPRKPIFGRLNPVPTGPDFEMLVFTAFPIAAVIAPRYAWAVLALGLAAMSALALHLFRKDARRILAGEA